MLSLVSGGFDVLFYHIILRSMYLSCRYFHLNIMDIILPILLLCYHTFDACFLVAMKIVIIANYHYYYLFCCHFFYCFFYHILRSM